MINVEVFARLSLKPVVSTDSLSDFFMMYLDILQKSLTYVKSKLLRDVIGCNFGHIIVQVDQCSFFRAPSGMNTFPPVIARFFKPIRLDKLWTKSFPNF